MTARALTTSPALVSFPTEETTIDVQAGATLQDICDTYSTPVTFGCRRAECGACMVRVVSGGENLSRMMARERELLELLGAAPDRRLACQCVVFGDVVMEVVD